MNTRNVTRGTPRHTEKQTESNDVRVVAWDQPRSPGAGESVPSLHPRLRPSQRADDPKTITKISMAEDWN